MELALDQIQVGEWAIRSSLSRDPDPRLITSIREQGVLRPLLVRRRKQEDSEDLELVHGHRRLAAAKKLGLATVPVVVVEGPDRELAKLVAVDHSLSQPLDPLGEVNLARCLHRNLGLTVNEVSILLGKNKGFVSDLIRIPELGIEVLRALEREDITIGHARALLRAMPSQRARLLRLTIEERLTVEQLKAVIAGRDVVSIHQLEEALAPFASLVRDGNGEILVQIRFRDLGELLKCLGVVHSRVRSLRGLLLEK